MNRFAIAIALFLCTLMTMNARAATPQKYLFNKLELPTGHSPQSVAVGDFNRDGYPDFVVVNNADATVGVYLGKPDGTFTILAPFSTGAATAPTAVVVADFNGDGKQDLAVTLNGGNRVAIFTGKGDGTFNAAVGFPTGSGPITLVAADFNGDGKIDLAIANNIASSVTVLLNHSTTSTLSFAAAPGSPHPVDANPTAIATGLINGDKFLDLAVASGSTNVVSILLGGSGGTFGAASHFNPGNLGTQLAVALADIDGDGKNDLLVGGIFGANVNLGNGNGTFQSTQAPIPNNDGAGALVVFDINGDRKPDVITIEANKFNGQYTFTVNINKSTIGSPAFAFPSVHYTGGRVPTAIAFADFNHDGRLDAVVVNKNSNTVSVLLGDGLGHFDPGKPTQLTTGRQGFYLTTADFNKDNNLDLAISSLFGGNSGNGVVTVLKGNGKGTFTETNFQVGNRASGIVAADLNGDGFPDLAVANLTDNTVSILLNNKSGGFTVTGPYATGGQGPLALAAGNFLQKGHMDLAVVNQTSSTLTILPNDGTGKFLPAVQNINLGTNTSPTGIAAGDFNGDGKPDLAVSDNAGNSLLVFLNKAGVFGPSPSSTIANLGQTQWVTTASLRTNGVLDLITTVGDSVIVALGKGDGTFAAPTKYPLGSQSGAVGVTVADVNADGAPDLLIANEGEGTLGFLAGQINASTGKPTGTFMPHEFFYVTDPHAGGGSANPVAIVAGDFNNDGFIDVALMNTGVSGYSIFLNTPAAALSTRGLGFPVEQLGSTSASKSATLFSSGVASLKPTATVSPSDYTKTLDTCTTVTLISGTHCVVSVDFSPKDINSRAGSILFTDNASANRQTVGLSGTGTEVNVNPAPVAFGSVPHNTSKTLTVTIKNLSGGTFPAHALTFTSIAVTGTGFVLAHNGCPASPSTLAAGLTCQIQITFTPNAVAPFNGIVTLTDNGGASPQKVALTGSGT